MAFSTDTPNLSNAFQSVDLNETMNEYSMKRKLFNLKFINCFELQFNACLMNYQGNSTRVFSMWRDSFDLKLHILVNCNSIDVCISHIQLLRR